MDVVTKTRGSYKIMECSMKPFPTEGLTHSPITATLTLLNRHRIMPEEIEEVVIRTISRAVDILADPSKYTPTSKETADHSLPYCIAAAIVDGNVTLDQFTKNKLNDTRIRSVIKKVKVVADPELEKLFPELNTAIVEVTCEDGQRFTQRVDFPKGNPKNRMTDEEVLTKFHANVLSVVSEEREKAIISKITNLETAQIRELTKLLART